MYQRLVQPLLEGTEPRLVTRLGSGFVVMAPYQFSPGYCLLIAYPFAARLNDLEGPSRSRFLDDMAAVGDAVLGVTEALRINYSIYGNLDPYLHAHIWPRYESEDEAYRTKPPFLIPPDVREAPEHRFDPARHGTLQEALRTRLHSR